MICVVGSINMDLVVSTEVIPKVGETVIGRNFDSIPGGKGANQAVAAARIGAETVMIGKLGDDGFGTALKASLVASGVDCSSILVEEGGTSGIALISVDDKAGNSIIVVPGTNYHMGESDIDLAKPLIQQSSIVVFQHELPPETVKYGILMAKHEGKITVLNPAPAKELEDAVLSAVDFLIPNEHELSVVAQMAADTEEDRISAARSLVERGVRNVIVTLGDKGCLFVDSKSVIHYPAQAVDAVDSTAAGDSFVGSFCASYEREKSIEAAIRLGQKAAALSVTRKGAQTSIPTLKEVQERWPEAK